MSKSSGPWQETFLSWFMTIGIPYALAWLALVVLPTYHKQFSPVIGIHAALGLYLVTVILVNFNKVINTDISVKSLPPHTKGLPVCDECQLQQPPRAFHCNTCRQCVDKRDHHCLFTGCCVGRQNHRYFICGVLAVFAGSLYGVVFEWDMVVAAAGGYSLWLPLQLTAPHLLWPFGLLDNWGLLVCVHNMLGLSVLVNAGVLVYLQLSALRLGQTQFERKRGITRYDRGLWQNVRNVLGERWLVALLWPLADSPLPPVDEPLENGGAVDGAGDGRTAVIDGAELAQTNGVGVQPADDQTISKRTATRSMKD